MVVENDGSGRLIAAGGDANGGVLQVLDPTTGSTAPWAAVPEFVVDSMAVMGSQVFMAMGGPGGKVEAYDESTGTRQWTAQTDGDVQAITARDGLVYAGGHFVAYCIGGTGAGAPFQCSNPETRGKLMALRPADGQVDDWDPETNGSLGVFALANTPNGIAVGGQFTRWNLNLPTGSQVAQQGFAVLGPANTSDQTPPSQPSNVKATAISDTEIDLTWAASTDNVGVDHYVIVRDGTTTFTNTAPGFADTGLTGSSDHAYAITAVDAAGNTSSPPVTVAAHTLPATPQGLAATSPSNTEVDLSWSPTATATSYRLYRGGTLIASPTGTNATDTTVSPGATYSYTVTAIDSAGAESVPSTPTTITTAAGNDTTPPSAPGTLQAAPTSSTTAHLSWGTATDNVAVDHYVITRNGTQMNAAGLAFDDSGLTPNTAYTYTVRAVDTSGNSGAESNAVTFTTPAQSSGLLADTFESGNLSKWTAHGSVIDQQTVKLNGSWAARTTTTGTPAYLIGNLSSTTPNPAADVHLLISSHGSTNVDLFRLQTAGGTVLATVSINKTNRLLVRNNVSGTSVTSTTTLSLGQWHELVLHLSITGASSTSSLSLDGATIATLSRTWNLGTVPAGRLQLGDSSKSRTSTVYFDDVTVN